MHVIEFQKRGLTHAHLLFIMQPDDSPHTMDDDDRMVCAEFTDPETQPQVRLNAGEGCRAQPASVLSASQAGPILAHYMRQAMKRTAICP